MTKKPKNNLLHSGNENWAIIDKDGKVIQKFRTKGSARNSLPYYQKTHIFELKVVWVD